MPLAFPVLDFLAQDCRAAESMQPLNRFPRMVHEYFVNQVQISARRGERAFSKVTDETQATEYLKKTKAKIRECFGPMPERTPLNAQITGVVERDGYQIEKLIYESRPGFPVTANLYVPTNRKSPMPGVVGTCGHSQNGKAAEPYQAFAQGLARQGYVCLIYDPIGQGERSQYIDDDGHLRLNGTVREHLMCGNQQFLVGEFLGTWRAWDGIRALDYLLTRDEVDRNQVGVTGNSGGGTMTTWLCGLESRWSMAAPGCFVTTFAHNMENELPADTEQCPPKSLALGLDHADFLAAMAPKPIVILAKERDFFDVRGAAEAYDRLRRLYAFFDKEDQISLFTGPTTHGYSQENREAMYRWFNQVTRVCDATSEPELTMEADETLWCTAKGQVGLQDAKKVFDFTREKSLELAVKRDPVNADTLPDKVREVLKLKPRLEASPPYRVLRAGPKRGYPLPYNATYAVETEPGILALVYMMSNERWYSRPPQDTEKAILYVSHRSSDVELRTEALIRETIEDEPDARVFSVDVRGVGESQPNTCGNNTFDDPYGCDYFYAIHSLMLDRPYLGQKTYDVLRVLDFLKENGFTQIHLVGKGWGALAATFAGLLSNSVRQISLKNALTSYADVAEHKEYNWPLATLLPDVLSHFDLPDCYRALQSKSLRLIEPWDASGEPLGR
ncbi:Acetyl xylan esterase (AXE1) [Planctomycetes bacterium CA13]|uniref:Acetyl xylan esterase (AXE1) n=2 Tax=Novipirellula herctigrandis TaxID=2527986 RepID=A0A5C5YXG7_9BACT|nr:Acetyl xylan esterase (AXE1) [Planctomycetes bacterium CA13]